jgi:hypothetical protein
VAARAALAAAPSQRLDGARRFATVALAHEVVAEPALLNAYARSFRGDDDATLVIYAPGWSADEAAERIGRAVADAGLDGDDAADVMAHLTPVDPDADAAVASSGDALLTAHAAAPPPLDALPAFSAAGADALRALAESRWR